MKLHTKLLFVFGLLTILYVFFISIPIYHLVSIKADFSEIKNDKMPLDEAIEDYQTGIQSILSSSILHQSNKENFGRQYYYNGKKLLNTSIETMKKYYDVEVIKEILYKESLFVEVIDEIINENINMSDPYQEANMHYLYQRVDTLLIYTSNLEKLNHDVMQQDYNRFEELLGLIDRFLIGGFVFFLFGVLSLIMYSSDWLSRPIQELNRVSKKINSGSLAVNINLPDDDFKVFKSTIHGLISNIKNHAKELEVSNKSLKEERSMFISGRVVTFKWIPDKYNSMTYVSPNLEEVFGYLPEELLKRKIEYNDIIHPEDYARYQRELLNAVKKGKDRFEHSYYRAKDKYGKWKWLYHFTRILRGDDGNPESFMGYILDVSEHAEYEEKIKRDSKVQEILIDTLSGFINIEFSAALKHTVDKFSKYELIDSCFFYRKESDDNFHLSYGSRKRSNLKRKIDSEDIVEIVRYYERENKKASEETKKYFNSLLFKKIDKRSLRDFFIVPVEGREGRYGFFIFLPKQNKEACDCSKFLSLLYHILNHAYDNYIADKKLKASEQKFRETYDLVPNMLFEMDLKGKILYHNKLVADLFCKKGKNLLGTNAFDMVADSSKKLALENTKKVVLGIKVHGEYDLITPTKKAIHVLSHSIPIIKDDNVVGLRVSLTDVSLLKKAQEELANFNKKLENKVKIRTKNLEEAYSKLKELDVAKDSFLSNVSHELRTPLTSVKSFNQLLIDEKLGKLSEEQKEALDIMLDSTNGLITLIDSLLDLSRYEAGRAILNLENNNMTELAENVANKFGPMVSAIGTLKTNIDKNLECVCDKNKINEVLMNLIGNSFKYRSEKRRLKIEVSARQVRNNIEITIKDNGIGISEENRKHIFDKFYQVDQSMIKKVHGAGLGLSIVKNIMELHKGKIKIESELDRGTEITVVLPLGKKKRQSKKTKS